MGVNALTFEQASTLLNAINAQVTGQDSSIEILDLASFVTVGQTTLSYGTEPIFNAISQIIGRTIYSQRKYISRFSGMYADSQQYGYITRKLKISDRDWDDNGEYLIEEDEEYTTQFHVKKPNPLQLNFVGQNTYRDHYTVTEEQLRSAFESPAALGSFFAMVAGNMADRIAQKHESICRATLINFIAGKIKANNGVIKVLTEYNAETGKTLTATSVMAPENYESFAKWLFARVQTVSDLMTERTGLYQIQINNHPIMSHSSKANQHVLMLSKFLNDMRARVQSGAYNESFLSYTANEAVNFWQTPTAPGSISAKPVYLTATGDLIEDEQGVTQTNILGIIYDRDAMGLTVFNNWTDTAREAAERYTNMWYGFTDRWWNDFTEKAVIFVLE